MEEREARARMVIFGDGIPTLANKKFGIGFDCRPDGTALAAACDIQYPGNKLDSLDFFFSDEVSPFGYAWIFPKKDLVNVGVLCLVSKLKQDIGRTLERFVSSVGLGSRQVVRFGSRLIPQAHVGNLHCDSVLVAGDAAGTTDPIDGGGISNAMVNGETAGKVAIEALEANDLKADFLGRFEVQWKKTENYHAFRRSYALQRLALKADLSMGAFLKQMGFFDHPDLADGR